MADFNFVNHGNTIEYAHTSAVTKWDVLVIGNQLAVAAGSYAANETGVYVRKGRFTLPKVSAAVIAAGEMVIWDVSAGAFDDNAATPATGDVSGAAVAAVAGAALTTTIDVYLDGFIGTVA